MYQRILVPIDGSTPSALGLEEALRLATLTGAAVRLLHEVDVTNYASGFETYAAYCKDVVPAARAHGQKVLAEGAALAKLRGVSVETRLKEVFAGRVADAVVDDANEWQADLIVIGTHGRRGASRLFLGSDAEQIARCAPVPVLLVRSRDAQVDQRDVGQQATAVA